MKIKPFFVRLVQKFLSKYNLKVVSINGTLGESSEHFFQCYTKCSQHSMTSVERMWALYNAISYISQKKIPGDIVECGVWAGGSMMLAASKLLELNSAERLLYLYDTFSGMSEPTVDDVNINGTIATSKWKTMQKNGYNEWDFASLDLVKKNMESTNYPEQNIRYIVGKVEDTIPNTIPAQIALLRLDTDWYESTYHEMTHLYDRLVPGGVLIIDDYGHWQGARKAVDQFFKERDIHLLLNRIDYTSRIAIKQ